MTDAPELGDPLPVPLWAYRLAVSVGVACVWAALSILLADALAVQPDGRTGWATSHSQWLVGWTATAITAAVAGTLTSMAAARSHAAGRLAWLAATVVIFLIALLADVLAYIDLSGLITT